MNLIEETVNRLNQLDEQYIQVYHGTNNIFNEFKNIKDGIGFWFSTDKEYASEHGNHLLSVSLNLDNILDLEKEDDLFWGYVEEFFNDIVDDQIIFASNEFGKFLEEKGYDAISWTHNDGTTYVVFSPEHIEIKNLQEDLADDVFDDVFDKIEVYKVCMDTYTGKRLYLAQTNTNVKHWKDAKTYEWQFSPEGAMEFDDKETAEAFAKTYFKHFDKWYIYKTVAYR